MLVIAGDQDDRNSEAARQLLGPSGSRPSDVNVAGENDHVDVDVRERQRTELDVQIRHDQHARHSAPPTIHLIPSGAAAPTASGTLRTGQRINRAAACWTSPADHSAVAARRRTMR